MRFKRPHRLARPWKKHAYSLSSTSDVYQSFGDELIHILRSPVEHRDTLHMVHSETRCREIPMFQAVSMRSQSSAVTNPGLNSSFC